MEKIRVGECDLTLIFLPPAAFYRMTNSQYESPIFSDGYSFDDYIEEKRDTEDLLRDALSEHWVAKRDFEVGADENFAFTMCGGIYTPRILCLDYIGTLFSVLRTTRMWERWAYSTSIELKPSIDGLALGDFILRRDTIWVNSDLRQFNFIKYFSRSMQEAAR